MITYLNINSLRENFLSLRGVSIPAKFPPLQRGRNSKGGGKMVFIHGFYYYFMVFIFIYSNKSRKFETTNAETICHELIIAKKKWCILFAYRPPSTNKDKFFEEIFTSLNKMLGNYDNIVLAGDLNIDEINSCSD